MTATAASPERYMRQPDAAAYLKLGEPTLEKDRGSGRLGIPFIRVGSAIIYDREELDRWLAERRHSFAPISAQATPSPNQ